MSGKSKSAKTSNLFIHPDGTALAGWNAIRVYITGPTIENWDRLSNIGLYQGYKKRYIPLPKQEQQRMHMELKSSYYLMEWMEINH
jgi:hypothetical protein